MTGTRPPTIHDVAARAGVSKSLVSLVLRGAPNVSEHRRAAVAKAIAELGYRPSAAARSLVERRTRTIGVLVADLHNPFFAEVFDGLRTHAVELGYRTLLGSGDRLGTEEEATVETMLELRVEGLVLLSPRVSAGMVRDAARTTPVAIAGTNLRIPGVDTVSSDEPKGTALAVEHLVGLGHRRIAHIAGTASRRDPRREGYEAAMRRAGLGDCVRVIAGEHDTDEGGYIGMRELLADPVLPTAVLAHNDLAAVGALSAMDEAGVRVPEDVSLVGYDNSYLAGIRHLSLTSVNQPRLEIGRLSMAALHDRITGATGRARNQVVTPDLVVRQTTAPPPS
jgi:DNA-binding LacI/PurR family transcriptional regulator